MRSLRTVLLRHDRFGDSHYDWLIEHPDHPPGTGPLLAFRLPVTCNLASACSVARKCPLQRLADHRRVYLHYQGPLSAERGRVRRVDSGRVLLFRFSSDHIDLQLTLRQTRVRIAMRRVAIATWSAALCPV